MTKVRRRTPTPRAVPAEAVVHQKAETFLGDRHGRIVIGIDASLTGTALAMIDVDSGEWAAYRHRPKHRGVRRLLEIQRFVFEHVWAAKMTSDEVLHVCMEGYAFSRQMAHSIGEGGAAVKMALISALGVNNQVAYPSVIANNGLKKFVTGSGKVSGEDRITKSDMKLSVFKKWGPEFRDDNECDAFALAKVAHALADDEVAAALAKYARDALFKTERHAEWDGTLAAAAIARPGLRPPS